MEPETKMKQLTVEKVKSIFTSWLTEAGYKPSTIRTKIENAKHFFEYVDGQAIDFRDVGTDFIKKFWRFRLLCRKR